MELLDYLVWPFMCHKSCPFTLLYWAPWCEWGNNILTRKASRWKKMKAPSFLSYCCVQLPITNICQFGFVWFQHVLRQVHLGFPWLSLLSVQFTVLIKECNTVKNQHLVPHVLHLSLEAFIDIVTLPRQRNSLLVQFWLQIKPLHSSLARVFQCLCAGGLVSVSWLISLYLIFWSPHRLACIVSFNEVPNSISMNETEVFP